MVMEFYETPALEVYLKPVPFARVFGQPLAWPAVYQKHGN